MSALPLKADIAQRDRQSSGTLSASRSLARNLVIGGNPSMMPALSSKNRLALGAGFAMRFTGNYFSEWAYGRGVSSNHTLLVPLVACAVGATASGAVILSLAGSPATQPSVSSNSPRVIVRSAGTSEPTENAQDRPMVETPPRPAVTNMASGRNEPVTQTESEHQTEVHSQQSRKHSQQHSREPHWHGRFAHAYSPLTRFSSW